MSCCVTGHPTLSDLKWQYLLPHGVRGPGAWLRLSWLCIHPGFSWAGVRFQSQCYGSIVFLVDGGPSSLLAVGQGPPSFTATWACPGVAACVSQLHQSEREKDGSHSLPYPNLRSDLPSAFPCLLLEGSHRLPRSTWWECIMQGCEDQEVGGISEAATQVEDRSSSMIQ